MATAAKAKVLLREVKTIKADLAFAKERCSQLEEENRALREAGEKGDNPADDDLVFIHLLCAACIIKENLFFSFFSAAPVFGGGLSDHIPML